MAATFRTSAAGGSTSGTSDRTATIVPTVGDLLVVYAFVSTNTNDTPACSDNNGGGTYTRIDVANVVISTVNHRLSVFVRDALMVNTTSTVITVATGSNTSGAIHALAISGMSRVGADAVRSKGLQNNQAAGTAAPALNQSALTGNLTIAAQGSADTTTTPPTNWTERQDTNFATPTIALETATRNSGFTGTAITFGAASSTTFCSHALELDGSGIFSGAAAIDGVGAITTAGMRELLRSTILQGTGSIEAAGTFFSVLERTLAVDAVGTIETSGIVSGSGPTVYERSASIEVVGGISTQATFFSVFERSVGLGGVGGIESSGVGFTVLERSASVGAMAAITSIGMKELFRAAGLTGTADISTSGLKETPGEGGAVRRLVLGGGFHGAFSRWLIILSIATSIDAL